MSEKRQRKVSFSTRFRHWLDERLRIVFPFRQIMLRSGGRVRCLNLTPQWQGMLASILLLIGGWIAFSSASVFFHKMQLAEKDVQIANVRVAYRSLLGEVADYQKRFSGVVRNLEENQSLMMDLAGQKQSLKMLNVTRQARASARAKAEATRITVQERLDKVDAQMQSLAQRSFSLKGNISSMESDLQNALTQRNTALMQSTQMRRDVKILENQLVSMENKENKTVDRLTGQTETFIASMENMVEMTGLDVRDLMAGDQKRGGGQGGPFIAFKTDGRPGGRLKIKLQNLENRLVYSDRLQSVVKKLPFAPPMQGYYVTSKFGKRRDPMNGRWAMHYGLDLGSTPRAAILVPAPGKVLFAGRKGSYGNMVIVNHGAGITTRYGHLSKITVKKGEKVSFGEKIGIIGSTGRSTGRHLHYEVLFHDKPLNPMQFIKAGRYVFKE